MKKILFAGYGPETVHIRVDGQGGNDYFVDGWATVSPPFLLSAGTEAMLVYPHRSATGCWYFGIGRLDEKTQLPAWRVAIGTNDEMWGPETTVLIIEVPLEVQMHQLEEAELQHFTT